MIKWVAIKLIRVYQIIISPLIGSNCRFYPSCSAYMIEAMERFGFFKGLYLGIKRLGKCHPLHEGGMDPVPEKKPCKHKH
ncbi:hypothetical protein MED121_22382 [Marinomonas sp. MED121]|uniref:membrane protein insertion efficiency factor YidD n=1 Tax=Marinomonas sp. MED121 TaxID=314277 RepID=UPI000068FDA2|nr:membrane protein insertion efficiency factor YidD [Marinomonas sp. MED121]EAQ65466.1 hypothetical protein MED121_22382 [Marinomonas sp. MED121]